MIGERFVNSFGMLQDFGKTMEEMGEPGRKLNFTI